MAKKRRNPAAPRPSSRYLSAAPEPRPREFRTPSPSSSATSAEYRRHRSVYSDQTSSRTSSSTSSSVSGISSPIGDPQRAPVSTDIFGGGNTQNQGPDPSGERSQSLEVKDSPSDTQASGDSINLNQESDDKDPNPNNRFREKESPARKDWDRLKEQGIDSAEIDELMGMVGLEEVKRQFLAIRAKIKASQLQQTNTTNERFNIIFQGNPGTGKHAILREPNQIINKSF